MTDFSMSTPNAADVLGVTRAVMGIWRKKGTGPTYELASPDSEHFHSTVYLYRLRALLDFLASRRASKTKLAAVELHFHTARRQKLARKADAARMTAMSAIRRAHTARAAAADAGHKPSVKILAAGEF